MKKLTIEELLVNPKYIATDIEELATLINHRISLQEYWELQPSTPVRCDITRGEEYWDKEHIEKAKRLFNQQWGRG